MCVCVLNNDVQINFFAFTPFAKFSTVQRKYFEGYKFRRFCCFPAKCENYFRKNERTPIVMWLNYACNLQNLFSMKAKF